MTKRIGFIGVTLAILLAASPASAQVMSGFKFSTITVSSGDDAISSGITGIVRLENEKKQIVEVAVQAEQAWILYGKTFKVGHIDGVAAGSVGHFQGAGWVGPYLTLNASLGKIGGQKVSLSTMQWPAFFLGWEPRDWKNNGTKNPESVLVGYLASFQFSVGPVGLTYTKLNFLDDPWNTLPGVSFTQSVRKDLTVTASASKNQNAHKWLLYVGTTWTPQ